jgi:hypothetical protein
LIRVRLTCEACERIRDAELGAVDGRSVCECAAGVDLNSAAVTDGRLERCPACGTADLYLQKDFPERLGLVLTAAGVIAATIAWSYYSAFWCWVALFSTAALDWALFRICGDVLICYRCLAQIRGLASTAGRQPFELGVHERYRQERLRKKELREQRRDGT